MAALDPITALANVVNTVLGRVLPDKVASEAAQAQLAQMALSGELAQVAGQLQIDNTEAANASVFTSGWRPFIGWICGLALCCDFIVRPVFIWACNLAHHPADFPTLDMTELMPLVLGMLGMTAADVTHKVMTSQIAAANGNGK